MNRLHEKYIRQFIEENDYYDRVYLPDPEQEKLNRLVNQEKFDDKNNPFEKYGYEEIKDDLYRFFEKRPKEVTDFELNQYIFIKMLELSKSMDKKQNTIKRILIFLLALTIVNALVSILIIFSR